MSGIIRFNQLADEIDKKDLQEIFERCKTTEEIETELLKRRLGMIAPLPIMHASIPRANWKRRLVVFVAGLVFPGVGAVIAHLLLPRSFGSGGGDNRGDEGTGRGYGGGKDDGYSGGESRRSRQATPLYAKVMTVAAVLMMVLGVVSWFGIRPSHLAKLSPAEIAKIADSDLTPTTRVAVAVEASPEMLATVAKVVVTTPEPTPTETAVPTSTGVPTPSISSLPAVNLLVKELNRINYDDPRTTTFDDVKKGKENIGIEVWLAEYAPENPHLIEMFTQLKEHEWEKAREAALLAQKLEPNLVTLPEDIVAAFVSRSGSYEPIPTPASVQVAEADATEESLVSESHAAEDSESVPTRQVEGSHVALSAPEQPQVDQGRVEEPARAAAVAPAETPFSAVAAAEDLAARQTAVAFEEIKNWEATAQAYNSVTQLQQSQAMAQATAQAVEAWNSMAEATRTAQNAYEAAILTPLAEESALSLRAHEHAVFVQTPSAPQTYAQPAEVVWSTPLHTRPFFASDVVDPPSYLPGAKGALESIPSLQPIGPQVPSYFPSDPSIEAPSYLPGVTSSSMDWAPSLQPIGPSASQAYQQPVFAPDVVDPPSYLPGATEQPSTLQMVPMGPNQ